MSIFTNPASRTEAQAVGYARAVLDLLGDRDPLEVLGETGAFLSRTVAELGPEALRLPEAPGKWSVLQVVCHLADAELVFGVRLRRVLAEDRPPIVGYDQDRWAERLGYADADPEAGLRLFDAVRASNLRLLHHAPAAATERVGVHGERGEETLADLVGLYAGHDLVHRRQIERIQRAAPSATRAAAAGRTRRKVR